MSDPHDLDRFVTAQAPVMGQVLDELRAGSKRSHWMWFVFPQLQGLGTSGMAQRYGIASLAEARAYLAHPVLGPRLLACCGLMLQVQGRSAQAILGSPDDLKFRSCCTLFALAAPHEPVFQQCLDRFYGGVPDPRTVALCGTMGP
ncbi:DUF1810 domain-containing protein [Ramlibacter ginsenosidimutans]|uniref:DUF1810 domain-containing protein n=1 Tax=Ramlibacter ginsenosidimutans TaxID=502333 RepID=A0A934WNY1_9BURK|nr:DUF1810 domain-containing protein [Ramlibacter ginsenosidimutans]MBK6009394.1 DUF1810 domain-containing protein [Ramlibacter ginsenosidimutans]